MSEPAKPDSKTPGPNKPDPNTPDPNMPDPNMDEILASIRRIITEEDGAPGSVGAPPADRDPTRDVLADAERAPARADANPAPKKPEARKEAAKRGGQGWVGETTAHQAASSFDQLSEALDTAAPPSIAMPEAGRTLEDLTRELLRPLLKDWLDENLPRIVQARVDEEVARIARLRVR